jgi:hypothetical protein
MTKYGKCTPDTTTWMRTEIRVAFYYTTVVEMLGYLYMLQAHLQEHILSTATATSNIADLARYAALSFPGRHHNMPAPTG